MNKIKKGFLRCFAECSDGVPSKTFSIVVKIKMLLITFGILDHCFFKYNLHLGLGHEDPGPYIDYRELQYNAVLGKVEGALRMAREEYSKEGETSKGMNLEEPGIFQDLKAGGHGSMKA